MIIGTIEYGRENLIGNTIYLTVAFDDEVFHKTLRKPLIVPLEVIQQNTKDRGLTFCNEINPSNLLVNSLILQSVNEVFNYHLATEYYLEADILKYPLEGINLIENNVSENLQAMKLNTDKKSKIAICLQRLAEGIVDNELEKYKLAYDMKDISIEAQKSLLSTFDTKYNTKPSIAKK